MLALRDAASEAKLGYWAEQISIQAEVVSGLALCAEGRTEECLDALQNAAAQEDATEKHVVTPGPLLPAREILADMLMADQKADEALVAYEAVLAKEPNRYRATLGAGRAARAAGDDQKATIKFRQLLDLGQDAEAPLDGLEEARAIVTR